MLRRPIKHRRSVSRVVPGAEPVGTDATLTLAISAGNVLVTSDLPLVIDGIPAITVQGELATAVVVNSPLSFTLDYAAAVIATNVAVVPPSDPAMRTTQGGYALPQSHTF